MPKPLLIITYYWPPGSSPGVQRWLKFVKYLPEFGWQPIILTVKNGSFPAEDPSLMEEIPDEVITYRASSIEPFALYNLLRGKQGKKVEVGMGNIKNNPGMLSRFANYIRANFFIPDARIGWNFWASRKMKNIIRKHQVKMVVTTGPPHSTHLMGLNLKANFPEVKWMADLRDPWTTVYYNQLLNRTEKAKQKDRQLETKVLKKADCVSVISEGMKREFEDRSKQIDVLYNGYDPEDMPDDYSLPKEHFIISYIGNFKVSQNIPAFWKALSRAISEHPSGKEVRFQIVGNVTGAILDALKLYKLEPYVNISPFVPHKEATKLMKECHLLYLPIPDTGNNKSIITGKIFEYLASRTPILGIGPEKGDAARLLNECERKEMLEYHEEEAIYNRLIRSLDKWQERNGEKEEVSSDAHLSLTRRALTRQLSNILNQLLKND